MAEEALVKGTVENSCASSVCYKDVSNVQDIQKEVDLEDEGDDSFCN